MSKMPIHYHGSKTLASNAARVNGVMPSKDFSRNIALRNDHLQSSNDQITNHNLV